MHYLYRFINCISVEIYNIKSITIYDDKFHDFLLLNIPNIILYLIIGNIMHIYLYVILY